MYKECILCSCVVIVMDVKVVRCLIVISSVLTLTMKTMCVYSVFKGHH